MSETTPSKPSPAVGRRDSRGRPVVAVTGLGIVTSLGQGKAAAAAQQAAQAAQEEAKAAQERAAELQRQAWMRVADQQVDAAFLQVAHAVVQVVGLAHAASFQ